MTQLFRDNADVFSILRCRRTFGRIILAQSAFVVVFIFFKSKNQNNF